jgi:hypothetical protein
MVMSSWQIYMPWVEEYKVSLDAKPWGYLICGSSLRNFYVQGIPSTKTAKIICPQDEF